MKDWKGVPTANLLIDHHISFHGTHDSQLVSGGSPGEREICSTCPGVTNGDSGRPLRTIPRENLFFLLKVCPSPTAGPFPR